MESLTLVIAGVAVFMSGSNFLENSERARPFLGASNRERAASFALMVVGLGLFVLGVVQAL